jgi:AcrR family transcriptional regulator
MKEKIRDKATELFLEHGFKSVTMDDLANEIGMSKKTIYAEYSNKTELIEDCVMNKFCAMSDGIDQIVALDKNPISELYEIKKYVLSHLKDEKSSPQYQLSKYYPKIFDAIKTLHFTKMSGCIRSNVQRGMERGIYRNNLDVEFVSRIYFTGVNSIKDQNMFPLQLFPIKALMDTYLEYHLRGIVTPEGRNFLNKIINSNQE